MALQGETPEAVAYALLVNIAACEHISIGAGFGGTPASREWILDTYAECLKAATGERSLKRDG